ncbi:MAG: CBS domain-containing protein [Actinomycetaceae bacterium]|nr:CBS domain-containing protein [Actinomycetaceae bacterium]
MAKEADPNELVDRFINAIEDAKRAFEREYKRGFTGLGQALNWAEEKGHPMPKNSFDELKALNALRNVMQHSRVLKGLPIAVPRRDTVERMEQLARWIENIPKIRNHMVKNVSVLSPESSLADAAKTILEYEVSQMPVYSGRDYLGLFTTNSMARWLSAHIDTDGSLLAENVTVGQVLEFNEASDRASFFSPNTYAYAVCEKLSSSEGPAAALITTDGTKKGELRGLVTRYDVARILKETTL